MVKKSSKAKTSTRRSGSFKARAKSAGRRAKSLMGGKIRWGEALLSALVGYEGDKILGPITGPIYDATNGSNTYLTQWQNDSAAQYGSWAKGVNKTLGALAVVKVGYDVLKHKHMDSNDISVYIPYAIGTVFDAPGGSGKSGSEVW